MCAESDKKEVTLQDIKQDIESLSHDMKQDFESLRDDMKEMKQESRETGVVTQLAFAFTLIGIGIGLFFLPYPPATPLGYFLLILGFAVGIIALVIYIKHLTPPKPTKKPRDG